MIPKIIHYCWFGNGAYTDEIEMCIASWKKFCPDYTIKCWDEKNSPMNITWVKEAYKYQKYAFMADYMRFYALYHEGGIYMDVDMLLKSSLDSFLNQTFFSGLQDKYSVNFAIMGSVKGFEFNKECLDFYDLKKFDMVKPPIITHVISKLLEDKGFVENDITQRLENGIVLYPSDFFYPIHYSQDFNLTDIESFCSNNTIGVHLWNKSWTSEFAMFEQKKYIQGYKTVLKRFVKTPFLPVRYYKKLIKYTFRFIIGK